MHHYRGILGSGEQTSAMLLSSPSSTSHLPELSRDVLYANTAIQQRSTSPEAPKRLISTAAKSTEELPNNALAVYDARHLKDLLENDIHRKQN